MKVRDALRATPRNNTPTDPQTSRRRADEQRCAAWMSLAHAGDQDVYRRLLEEPGNTIETCIRVRQALIATAALLRTAPGSSIESSVTCEASTRALVALISISQTVNAKNSLNSNPCAADASTVVLWKRAAV